MALADIEAARRELVARQRDELIPGELIAPRLGVPDGGDAAGPDEINAKYDRGEIRIVTEQARYPLNSIKDLLASGDYKLDPDYQRRHRWDLAQRSRLIESFIMNVPVPPIFLYEWDYSRYEVMDGLQRLTTVREFYSNSFALSGLEYWRELDGMRYEDLPSRIRDGINRRYLSSIVLLKETSHGDEDPERLKRFVFGRINTGGVKLSPQELRNALYDGPMNQLCKELATSRVLRRLWGIPEDVEGLVDRSVVQADDDIEDEEVPAGGDEALIPRAWRDMTDVELVLRFFANRQRMIAYRDNIRDYLDAYLREANNFGPDVIATLRQVFTATLVLAENLFGVNAFRRLRGERWGNVPSVSIYDATMNVLSRQLRHRARLTEQRDRIVEGLPAFYAENSRVFNLRGQTRADVMAREILFEEYLLEFLRTA